MNSAYIPLSAASREDLARFLEAPHEQRMLGLLPEIDNPELDQVLAALSSPVRRFLLELVIFCEGAATDLAAAGADTYGLSRSRISQHLAVLRVAGLARSVTTGNLREYVIEPAGFEPLTSWLAKLHRGVEAAGRTPRGGR